MIKECSLLRTLEVFFISPTSVHFIKEISRQIDLSPPSVRNHLAKLVEKGLIRKKESKPFDGFAAERESEDFTFLKRVYNIYSMKPLVDHIVSGCYPKAVVLFGSYSVGEDAEGSDIDVLVVSNTAKEIDVKDFEESMKRKIHILTVKSLEDLDGRVRQKVINGVKLHGAL
jgi:predicted nucleotidyltransferase